jgi:hypothetical protein
MQGHRHVLKPERKAPHDYVGALVDVQARCDLGRGRDAGYFADLLPGPLPLLERLGIEAGKTQAAVPPVVGAGDSYPDTHSRPVFDLRESSKEIASLLVFLLKVAPGAGVSVIGATQKPSGIGTGKVAQDFNSFRDNFGIRFGLRTSSWQVSELVLGAGAYSEGLDTSLLLPNYKGVGILRGATDASPTGRTYLADGQDAERILLAARQLRERAGTLSGMAAGLEVEKDDRDVLADVLQVFGSDAGLHWSVLAERLNTRIPDRWSETTAEAISAECRARDVPSVDVKQFGQVRKGYRRADVGRAAGQP